VPELIEVELYRQALDPLLGQTINGFDLSDSAFARPKGTPADAFAPLVGEPLRATSRRGKLLSLHVGALERDLVLGVRFGMTGRLLLDGTGPIDELEYASQRNDPNWDRVILTIGTCKVSVRDQRRLGSIELDPDIDKLGVEATSISTTELSNALRSRSKAIKAVLLDQKLIAGLGNLLADETLWDSGFAPGRSANTFDNAELETLATGIRKTVAKLTKRGGSHTGDTFEARTEGATCPRDGSSMRHDTIGGRSTWWCPAHQR